MECGSHIQGLAFESLMKGYFSLYFYKHFDGLYMAYMVVLSWVFILLLRGYMCVLYQAIVYGSQHVFTCKWMDNVSMA